MNEPPDYNLVLADKFVNDWLAVCLHHEGVIRNPVALEMVVAVSALSVDSAFIEENGVVPVRDEVSGLTTLHDESTYLFPSYGLEHP